MENKQKFMTAFIGEGHGLERKTQTNFKGTGNIIFPKLSCGDI